jgi:hypothetical protein
MGILDGFGARRYDDPALGPLARGWGCWRGQIALGDGQPALLVLAGWRSAPDPERLRLAQELVSRYEALHPAIARGLFEHYAPYGEAVAAGEEPEHATMSRLAGPDEVWAHVRPVRVLIERMGGREAVEIAYRVAWDEEHTLGVRFREWALVEVNGSVRA